jgi:hypothetical protein
VEFSGAAANTYGGDTLLAAGAQLRLNKSAGVNAIPVGSTLSGGVVTVSSANQIPDNVPITGSSLSVNAKPSGR